MNIKTMRYIYGLLECAVHDTDEAYKAEAATYEAMEQANANAPDTYDDATMAEQYEKVGELHKRYKAAQHAKHDFEGRDWK